MTTPAEQAPGLAAFRRYEEIRPRLPAAAGMPAAPERHADLSPLIERYDVFVLDGFGVLNVGAAPVPGAPERIAEMRRAGKRVIVLTNAATYPPAVGLEKYHHLGFDFSSAEIVSSRDVAVAALAGWPADTRWGVTAAGDVSLEGLPGRPHPLLDDDAAHDGADAILLLSGDDWGASRQRRLAESLARRPRPVVVANPDLVAPRETSVTTEPGAWAHDLMDALPGLDVTFCGKPFANAFEAVRARLGPDAPPPGRCAMVGDTLHTDVLGGAAAGLATVLVTAHGIYKGLDPAPLIAESGIVPDHMVETT